MESVGDKHDLAWSISVGYLPIPCEERLKIISRISPAFARIERDAKRHLQIVKYLYLKQSGQ